MFKTDASNKIDLISNDVEYGWEHVSLFFQHYWLYVTYEILDKNNADRAKNEIPTETVIFWRIRHLIELSKASSVKIKFVDLGSPGYMNGSERWKMEPLREIWLCADPAKPDTPCKFFVLENGIRYKDLMGGETVEGFKEDQLIFSVDAL